MEKFRLDISDFVKLSKKNNTKYLEELEIATQSINRWVQYCQYHYFMFEKSTSKEMLLDDKIFSMKYDDTNIDIRYVYEAHIAAFLTSLHALLDSFPYLLNLYIPFKKINDRKVGWNYYEFLMLYKGKSFYRELISFYEDENFNKVKAYVNVIKHKNLTRVGNYGNHLEFESFKYRVPTLKDDKIKSTPKIEEGSDVLKFLQNSHNELIPKFFDLCRSVQADLVNIEKH